MRENIPVTCSPWTGRTERWTERVNVIIINAYVQTTMYEFRGIRDQIIKNQKMVAHV